MARGGSVGVSDLGGGAPSIQVQARIEGLERTTAEFAAARRQFNATMRAVIQVAGEKSVLPAARSRFPRKTGKFAASLYVRKDRTTVYIGSRMRGGENRAVGWLDFGGKHPRHARRRTGSYVIVEELRKRRPLIDEAILRGLMKTFDPLEHRP